MVIKIDNRLKKIIIIASIIILLFLIIIAIVKINQQRKLEEQLEQLKQTVKQYDSIEDFQNMQEVALYMDCELIEVTDSKKDNVKYDVKLITNCTLEQPGAENYFEKLIQYSAYVLKYENFYLVDEDKNIIIYVTCNKDANLVSDYYINEKANYFKNQKTANEINNSTQIDEIKVDVQSSELKSIIQNGWRVTKDIGTIESTFDKYDIYFDEGFEIKKVQNKVTNIVFNEKYEPNIINNLSTKSTLEEIEKTLGKPHFEVNELIGYKSENLYIFFFRNQVSVYKKEKYETDKLVELLENFQSDKNLEKLITEVKQNWTDYDIFEYGTNSINLQYTSKGIAFRYGINNNNGIFLYNNYDGKITRDKTLKDILENKQELPNNFFYEDKDLVLIEEENRIGKQYDSTVGNNHPYGGIYNISKKFKVSTKLDDNDLRSVKVIAINKQYPNSELKEKISNGIWYNDDILIYSIKNRGIFYYNAVDRTYGNIVNGVDEYRLVYIENGILYYDDTSVKIEI